MKWIKMFTDAVVSFGPALLVVLFAGACSARGPRNIPPDQFNYNQAIGQASNEQMLLNLIRLRYRDVPVFLAVSSVLTQYIYSSNVNVNGSLGTLQGQDSNSIGATAGFRYVERPTITYSPLTGEDFAEQVMTPIPGELIFSLMESGWPAADLLGMAIGRIGAARNPPYQALLTLEGQERHREFEATAALIIEVASREGIELIRDSEESELGQSHLVFDHAADAETAELIARLKRELGLAPAIWKFGVTRNLIEHGEGDVTIRNRSLLDLMGYLSGGVHVPPSHLDKHIARPSADEEIARGLVPLRIHSGPELPESAFASVNYLGEWFWISPDDDRSKESFGMLTYLFQMMASTPEGAGPLLTIPAG